MPPPPSCDRVKVNAKTWCGHIPTSTCPQACLIVIPCLYVTTVNNILKKEKMPKQYVLRNTKKSRLNPKI